MAGGGGGPTHERVNSTAAKRRYLPAWEEKHPWITYDATKDKVFCTFCSEADRIGAPLPGVTERLHDTVHAFTRVGFSSWNKALERFKMHEKSDMHRAAAQVVHNINNGVNVSASMSTGKAKQMADARTALMGILSTVQVLAWQGLAIRGHEDETSNFVNILRVRSRDIPELKAWLARKEYTWMSKDILNEMVEILAHSLLRTLLTDLQAAEFFSVIMDETADISVKEQASICIRVVTEELETEEVFLGFYQTASTTSETLFQLLQDVLIRFSLPVSRLRGQCYDGAANMAGARTGLQARMLELEPRAVFVHCTAHVLNLVAQDVVSKIKVVRDFMPIIRDLITLIKVSPKRLAAFKDHQDDNAPALKPLCPTRWTVKAESLRNVLKNYTAILEFLMDMKDSDDANAHKASGLLAALKSFNTFFNLQMMLTVFSRLDTVNTSLQSKDLHFQQAACRLDILRGDMQSLREGFQPFWESTVAEAKKLGVGPKEPKEVRVKSVPIRFDSGGAPSHVFPAASDMYRQRYYEVLDMATSSLATRFTSSGHKHMQAAEDFLVRKGDSRSIVPLCGKDYDIDRLTLHRDMMLDFAKREKRTLSSFHDVVEFFKGNGVNRESARGCLPEVAKLVKQMLTVPVTSCSAERSFSGLKRLKTYLRSTMGQARLNHLALLNCHRDIAQDLDLEVIANDFISRTAVRRNTFLVI